MFICVNLTQNFTLNIKFRSCIIITSSVIIMNTSFVREKLSEFESHLMHQVFTFFYLKDTQNKRAK